MASLRDIRRRIRSVKNTQQITRAMKMVAAARLRRATERILAARPYAKSLGTLLAGLARRTGGASPLMQPRESEQRILLAVVTGDKGLCGAFNTNILRAAHQFVAEKKAEGKSVTLVTVGRKGGDFFRRRGASILASFPGIFSKVDREAAGQVVKVLETEFRLGAPPSEDEPEREAGRGVDAVYLVYNEFKSVIAQNLRIEKLLPIEAPEVEGNASGVDVDYIYEPAAAELLDAIIPRHLEFQVLRVLLESAAAEHGARMTAMDAATGNAGDMINSLTLTYNRARQARITKELIEIVSGANAM